MPCAGACRPEIGIEPKIEVAVAREKQWRPDVERQVRSRQLALPLMDMAYPGSPLERPARSLGRLGSGTAAEAEDFEQRVAHHAVATVDPASDLAGTEQPRHVGRAVAVDGDAAVLVVQRRIHHERRPCAVEPALLGQMHKRPEMLPENAGPLRLEPGRVEEG